MPRPRRETLPLVPYHIVQRTHRKQFLFEDDAAKAVLMKLMIDWRAETGVMIAAFVLMSNHFHLVGESPTETALGRFMGNVCGEFSRFLNLRSGHRGTNWQGRYYASPLDPLHALATVRYIERNPVAASMVSLPWEYHWSSAAYHCGLAPKPQLLTCDYRPLDTTARSWSQTLRDPLDDQLVARIRAATHSCAPLGNEDWVAEIERRLGRTPKPPRGRPRK